MEFNVDDVIIKKDCINLLVKILNTIKEYGHQYILLRLTCPQWINIMTAESLDKLHKYCETKEMYTNYNCFVCEILFPERKYICPWENKELKDQQLIEVFERIIKNSIYRKIRKE